MDSSRRAVESYWRSRMIDGATSEEDKVTPVYKLEEICELLRSSPAGIVKEISDFVLKRLDHKSPVVKQKALRLIKFAVGKSGVEFRREMQRHSVAVRQLLHYRGKPDPLKGDALNKAVRETAQEALSAVFSNEDNKPAPAEDVKRRIEGFGNTNFVPPMEEKKSFLSEVVDLGSASIKQGLSTLTQGHSQKNRDNGNYGSYKGPTLRRSLTNEIDYTDKYEKMDRSGSNIGSYGSSNNITSQSWEQDSRQIKHETNGSSSSNSAYSESKTREERLLETIVTSGGVRLQPTRDALQAFLVEALKMDAVALCIALESKLHSPSWQVRMKAVCVLEAILRKSDYEHFAVVESFFNENIDIVVQCSESPQASLREKANKVLGLLGRAPAGATGSQSEKLAKSEPTEKIEMPNLIDTGGAEDLLKGDDPLNSLSDQNIAQQSTASPPIDDLFGGGLSSSVETNEQKNDLFGGGLSNSVETIEQKCNDDPFADVSFHTSEDKEQGSSDLFAGMNVGNDSSTGVSLAKSTGSDPFDFFGVGSEVLLKQNNHNNEFENLMAGLSLGGNSSSVSNKAGDLGNGSTANGQPQSQHSNGKLESQTPTMTANTVFPVGPTPYNMAPGFMFNQPYPSTALNYGAIGGLLSQQQLIAAMANLQQLQQLGTLNSQTAGVSFGSEASAGYSSAAFPDIFNTNMPNQASAVTMNNSKKEETKAFDFISDHMAAARDTKRCS